MENKTNQEQKEMLRIAEDLEKEERRKGFIGYESMKAYCLAGRSDIALNRANALLEERHTSSAPYEPKNWGILKIKEVLDEYGLTYNSDSVKSGIINTFVHAGYENPSQKEIHNIEDILVSYEINPEDRKNFFVNIRERIKEKRPYDEIASFAFGGKETGYSNLASFTGVSRKDVVTHYLEGLFEPENAKQMYWSGDDFIHKELSKFVERENIDGKQIVGLVEKAMSGFKDILTGKPDYQTYYHFLTKINQVSRVHLPKETIIITLKDHIENGGSLPEHGEGESKFIKEELYGQVKDDPEILQLRKQYFKNEIENGDFREVEYGIEKVGLNPEEGWVKNALESVLTDRENKFDKDSIDSAIYIGKKYNLLSQKKIDTLEMRLKLIKSLE